MIATTLELFGIVPQKRSNGVYILGFSELPIIVRARQNLGRTSIIASEGMFTYEDLLDWSETVASWLLKGEGHDLNEQRVAFLVPPSFIHVAIQWGIWRAGGIAVPLAISHPLPELDHVLGDAGVSILVVHPEWVSLIEPLTEKYSIRFASTELFATLERTTLPHVQDERRAMIIYTSGTTNKPKGVVFSHRTIQAQVSSLVEAWGWTEDDHILGILPLHHIHGIINVVTCALWSGAVCEILGAFTAESAWKSIVERPLTLFMAVPTIYSRMIDYWEEALYDRREVLTKACSKVRLMVSGSAALPVATLEKWDNIAGHTLLERYGMSEIGMALSNPLVGERRPGFVGVPLPSVGVRLVNEDDKETLVPRGSSGEIQVQGPTVFLEYWNNPQGTSAAFKDGWFLTGDIAVFEEGSYRILGRDNVDIIKTGGFKVSALEIEDVLLTHPLILECAVFGRKDDTWGEKVCVAIVLRSHSPITVNNLREWARQYLAPYKLPTEVIVVKSLPRNAMGKVTKTDLIQGW